MTIEIIHCEQNSPEWFAARMGIPTASEFKTIIGIKKDAKDKLTRKTYMRKLAGEILTGEPMQNYTNPDMERGKVMEEEARNFYALTTNAEPMRVGFIRNKCTGCSPDSLIGANGGLEIKTALPHIQLARLDDGVLPPEFKAQVQGNLWVAEREWWDFVSYWPKLRMLKIRVTRDEEYIKMIEYEVEVFNEELRMMVKQHSLERAA